MICNARDISSLQKKYLKQWPSGYSLQDSLQIEFCKNADMMLLSFLVYLKSADRESLLSSSLKVLECLETITLLFYIVGESKFSYYRSRKNVMVA